MDIITCSGGYLIVKQCLAKKNGERNIKKPKLIRGNFFSFYYVNNNNFLVRFTTKQTEDRYRIYNRSEKLTYLVEQLESYAFECVNRIVAGIRRNAKFSTLLIQNLI